MSTNGNAKKRLYVLSVLKEAKLVDPKSRLIRATSQAAALKFATEGYYRVDVAGTEDVALLLGEGTKIEEAVS